MAEATAAVTSPGSSWARLQDVSSNARGTRHEVCCGRGVTLRMSRRLPGGCASDENQNLGLVMRGGNTQQKGPGQKPGPEMIGARGGFSLTARHPGALARPQLP